MNVCCCSSPDCQMNGCQNRRRLQEVYQRPTYGPWPTYSLPAQPMPVDVETLRTIIREEIERAMSPKEAGVATQSGQMTEEQKGFRT